ncbi:alanyl-tRNA editing protein [Methylobacterium frigidaeris]|uniref:Alanine--tRNA ligase n=1 Tax=Methylobacterium frigidaeris TaxID=2038277 RepID=A0AA37M5V9_9HYPH|nr:alanyl-tRNA editing protein [Methylobacterium frigidaeris]PIK70459.1 Ala-tRNA(Pro) hydrolase [Methylobacterium frigidaeris]GJD63877.1 Alanine--tRNA ligase [Methylobacterium frigidaeris]
MPTELLFRDDAYLREAEARIVVADITGLVLDRTLFYAQGGGQPGDRGRMVREDGTEIAILDTVYGPEKSTVLHRVAPDAALPAPGERVRLLLDWPLRHARMRVHTALHLLSVALPYPVTGGSIGDGEGRLDFDIPDAGLDKEAVTARLREMIGQDAAVTTHWISDEELLANPSLVKTMSVKPPVGSGRVRLVAIEGLDLQPCGGTHVRRTAEIGTATVTAIEKKGKQNRRVRLSLA